MIPLRNHWEFWDPRPKPRNRGFWLAYPRGDRCSRRIAYSDRRSNFWEYFRECRQYYWDSCDREWGHRA